MPESCRPSGAQWSNPPAVSQSTFPFSDNIPSTDEVFNNQKHIYFGFWNNLQLLISTFSEYKTPNNQERAPHSPLPGSQGSSCSHYCPFSSQHPQTVWDKGSQAGTQGCSQWKPCCLVSCCLTDEYRKNN